jgi:hypothetical protein
MPLLAHKGIRREMTTVARVRRSLQGLGPYQSLALLTVPVGLVEPLLLHVDPATMAGLIALLTYVDEHDDANDGMGWPEDIYCEEVEGNGAWQHCLINNLIEIPPKLVSVTA